MQTGERLRGIVETILRQLARQVGGTRVMQNGSSTIPAMEDQGQSGCVHAGNSGAEAHPPTTSAAMTMSATTEEYIPSTPATTSKNYFDSV